MVWPLVALLIALGPEITVTADATLKVKDGAVRIAAACPPTAAARYPASSSCVLSPTPTRWRLASAPARGR